MAGPRIGLGFTDALASGGAGGPAGMAIAAGAGALASLAQAIAGEFGKGRKQADIVTHAWADVTNPFIDRMYHAMADESIDLDEAKAVFDNILPQYEMWWSTNVLSRITDPRVRPQAEATLTGSDAGSLGNLRRALGEYIARLQKAPAVTAPGIDRATLGPGGSTSGSGAPSTAGPNPVAPLLVPLPLAPLPAALPGGGGGITTAPLIQVPVIQPSGGGSTMDFNVPQQQQQDSGWPGLLENIWSAVEPVINPPKPIAPAAPQDFFAAGVPWWVYVIAGIAVYELIKPQPYSGRRGR